MPSRIDETGNKYGKWTVLHYDEDSQNGKKGGGARWICQCECGTVKSILGTEYSFSNCYHKDKNKPLRFDFFVNNSYVIEFDGRQHFMENSWSSSSEKLKDLQVRDQIKNKYCLKNNIPIIRIPYYYINNITIQDLLPVSSNFLLKEGGI